MSKNLEEMMSSKRYDSVAHYQLPDVTQTIDVIHHVTKRVDNLVAYDVGNAIKYLLRLGAKGSVVDDLNKAKQSIEYAIKVIKETN